MHELYALKDMLIQELEEYGSKGELSTGTLDIVDKLAHATKNLCKVIEGMDEGESGYPMDMPYDDRGSYRYSRRRDSMGRYARDGREYSRGDLKEQLRGLANDTKDERVRQEIMKLISKVDPY